jgi:hypothetical protein
MHIAHALGHSLRGRRQLTVTTLIVTICITLALAVGGSAIADAAGPDHLAPGQSRVYKTWLLGETQVCVTNPNSETGTVVVQPLSNPGLFDVIDPPPFSQRCIKRWWFASEIRVTNLSPGGGTVLIVETSAP